MRQVIIDFGQLGGFPLRIYGYGLMLVLGFLCGIYLARWRARRFGENGDTVTTLGLLALVGGVVGARLAFVIEKWNSQFASAANPLLEIFNITSGGLIYYGGVLLATALIVMYLLLKRLPARRYLDIIAPSLMIGLAFGRMGCLLNGCCFGERTRAGFPMAMRFPYASTPLADLSDSRNIFAGSTVSPAYAHQFARHELDVPDWLLESRPGERQLLKPPSALSGEEARKALNQQSLPAHPGQLYGLINGLLIAGVLLAFSRLRSREGQVFALMLMLYPVTRFVLESVRGDNAHEILQLQFTHNQYSSVVMILAGLATWLALRRWSPSAGAFALERAEGPAGAARNRARKGIS
jgi:phosphatidylglycerol:prolipoprotein diacylglycerol transferase